MMAVYPCSQVHNYIKRRKHICRLKLCPYFVEMNKHIFVVIGIAVIFLFTALAGGLKFQYCKALFDSDCQKVKWVKDITGLVAASLVLFFIALVVSLIYTFKGMKWASFLELGALVVGAILMLTAVCLILSKEGWTAPSSTMCTIAMTLSLELSIGLAVQFIKGNNF
nr:expressed protein [Hymenolepis microstoma]